MADLEEAIRVGREAIDALPPDDPDRAMLLNNLGIHLGYPLDCCRRVGMIFAAS
jgi:hypothetical protein